MDDRQRQLIAAAETLRTWVHAQKVTWNASAPLPVSPFPTPAFAGSLEPSVHTYEEISEPQADDSAFLAEPSLPSISMAARIGTVVRALTATAAGCRPVVARTWRPAVAAVAIMALAGFARASWPKWSGAVKAQLTAAGQHVSVFDRPPAESAANAAPGPSNAPTAPVRRLGRLQIASTPAGVHVLLDGKDRGVTPLTVNEVTAGNHTIVLTGEPGTIQRVVNVGADKTTEVNEAIFSGWVHVSSSLELQVSEAGSGLRLDESNQILLAPGTHELRLENKRVAFVETRKVDIRPGDTTSIDVEPPPSKLTVTASTPAEVLIDGTLVGGTPLTDYPVQVGSRDITVRNASGDERRSTVTVTVAPMQMQIDFAN